MILRYIFTKVEFNIIHVHEIKQLIESSVHMINKVVCRMAELYHLCVEANQKEQATRIDACYKDSSSKNAAIISKLRSVIVDAEEFMEELNKDQEVKDDKEETQS